MDEVLVSLKAFRAFKNTGPLSIRPLTFLVGENSTGKTSFLAALNFLFRFQEHGEPPTLNQDPFDLGSFEQIVHHARGADTSSEFQLSMVYNVNVNSQDGILSTLSFGSPRQERSNEVLNKLCRVDVTFQSFFGSPEVSHISFTLGETNLRITIYPHASVRLQLGVGRIIDLLRDPELPLVRHLFTDRIINIRAVGLIVNSLVGQYFGPRGLFDGNHEDKNEITSVLQAFGAAMNTFPQRVFPSAPIRSTPERVYSASDVGNSPDGRGTPYRLRRAKIADAKAWARLRSGLNQFGRLSGLFGKLDVGKLTRESAGPFQLRLQVGDRRANIADVGYGVSQSLPLITDLLEAPERAVFLFQQPEVHLHPKAQAGLGTYLCQYMASHLRSIVVAETHSDYILDRVRTEVRSGTVPHSAVSILYFEEKNSDVRIHQITIDKTGALVDAPECYRDFFLREQAYVLGVEY